MICYYFPPIHSVGVLRNFALQEQFAKHFKIIHVFTTNNNRWMNKDPQPIHVATVTNLPTFDYRTLAYSFGSKHTHQPEINKKKWQRKLLNINNSFPFNIIFGEGGLLYIVSGFLKGVILVNRQKINFLYSSYTPTADHIIAWLLKLVFGKKLKWIADFRDLHVDPIYRHVIWENLQHRTWERVLKRAFMVTTVSDGLACHLRNYHHNIKVVRNGIKNYGTQEVISENLKKFTIAYTGSMVKNERDPSLVLLAIQQLLKSGTLPAEKIQIVYAGKDSQSWKALIKRYELGSLFSDRGLVSHEQAISIQKSAHINLLLSSSHSELKGVLTGKFCEYLAARRPVLCLINGTQDPEFEHIFATTKAGIIAYNNLRELEKIKSFITDHFKAWQLCGDVECTISEESISPFKWDNIASELIEKIGL